MDRKLSQLTAVSSVSASDSLYVVQGATSKRATVAQLLSFPSSTFASLPAASSQSGSIFKVSDIGNGGTLFISNGTFWRPLNGVAILASSAIASSVTGTTSETTLSSITVPGNLLGANGVLRVTALWTMTNSANNKTPRLRFSGAAGTIYVSATLASTATFQYQQIISNRNATNSQIGMCNGSVSYGSSGLAAVTSAVDTTADTILVLSGQLANSGETITLERYMVEVLLP